MRPSLFLPGLAFLLVVGCGGASSPDGSNGGVGTASTSGTGGSGTSTGTTGGTGSEAFAGTWSGAYTQPSASPTYQGTMRLLIVGTAITGSVHDASHGDGVVDGVIGYLNFTPLNITFSPHSGVSTQGYLKVDARGHLIGIVPTTQDQDSRPPEIDFDLAPVTSP